MVWDNGFDFDAFYRADAARDLIPVSSFAGFAPGGRGRLVRFMLDSAFRASGFEVHREERDELSVHVDAGGGYYRLALLNGYNTVHVRGFENFEELFAELVAFAANEVEENPEFPDFPPEVDVTDFSS